MGSKLKRWQLISLLVVFFLFLTGLIFLHHFGERLLTDAFYGRSIPILNRVVAHHRASRPSLRDLAFYLRAVRRLTLIWALLALAAAVFILLLPLRRNFYQFLLTPDSALNLALTRIVACAVTLITACHYAPILFQMSHTPLSVRLPPPGLGWLYQVVPFIPITAILVSALLIGSCLLSIVGVFSRHATAIACVSAIWAYGALFSFSVERHILHILAAALAVLAASPCADALALELKWRKPALDPSVRRSQYGLPLRILWVVIGLSYFFPGAWKLAQAGHGYVFGNYMRTILLTTEPAWLHLVDYPLLCRLMGLGAIAWELGFIVAIFSKRLRVLAAIFGIVFHLIVFGLMKIPFFPLMAMYVCLIDWDEFIHRNKSRICAPAILEQNIWTSPEIRSTWVVGVVFILGYALTGAAGFQTFPISCYPTFSWGYETTKQVDTAFYLVDDRGRLTPRPDGKLRAIFSDYYWDNMQKHISSDLELDPSSRWANAMLAYWNKVEPLPAGTSETEVVHLIKELDPKPGETPLIETDVVCHWTNGQGCVQHDVGTN
ncbi:hypothetical protein SAMN05421819_0957 [Bryocella elongata]|uniref:Vitamin K-dependent gamma-carboxylase n=1 Tax=Bryocella elongata TaxID=863522 RepID=A0A1H5UBP6_9BACT|nr:hypothetical protein [Bryocella elongata]SEF72535.1 hypothetical protein SAMN05421819_0957 [Bryocella elongata]